VSEESLGRTGAQVCAVEQVPKGSTFVDPGLNQEPIGDATTSGALAYLSKPVGGM